MVTTEGKTTRASIYVRISLDRTGEQVAVGRQLEECQEFVQQRGWEVAEVFTDNDISATSGKARPAFERLLQSDPEVIVCWHIDRLVRVSADLERVIDLGVNVHAVKAGHLDLSHPAGRAVARTVTAWSTYEGEQRTIRQKSALEGYAKKGARWWARRPFGHEKDGTLHPVEAPAVQAMVERLLSGSTLGAEARRLNDAEIWTTTGRRWSSTTVRAMVTAPRLAGIRTYNGEEVGRGDWEQIISEADHAAVLARLASNVATYARGGPRRYLLTGLARCGICRGTLTGTVKRTRLGDRWVYVCRQAHVSRPVGLVDEVVEWHVFQRLRMMSRQLVDSGAEPEHPVVDTGELDAVRRRMDETAEAYAAGAITMQMWQKVSEDLRKREQAALDALATATGNRARYRVLAQDDFEVWWHDDGATMDEKREVVAGLVDVYVLKTKRGWRPTERSILVLPKGEELPESFNGMSPPEGMEAPKPPPAPHWKR